MLYVLRYRLVKASAKGSTPLNTPALLSALKEFYTTVDDGSRELLIPEWALLSFATSIY